MMVLLEKTWLLLLCVFLYFGIGYYNNNFYRTLIHNRANAARKDPNHLHVAVVHGSSIPTGFLTGAEMAVEDINQNNPGRITLHELDSSRESDSVAALDSLLSRDMNISMVVAEAPDKPNKIAVICESYGAGLLLVNPDPTFLPSPGFHYVVKVGPRYSSICQSVLDNLSRVTNKPEHKQIRVGLFFDQSAVGGEDLVNIFLGVNRSHNELYRSAVAIQKAVDEGLLKGDQPLDSLDDTLYIQSGVTVAGSILRDFLVHESTTANLTTQQALDRTPVLKNPIQLSFVRGFETAPFNPDRLEAVTKSDPLDCIVLIANLPKTTELIRRIRALKVSIPVICLDWKPAPWVTTNLGPMAQGLYLVSSLDPSLTTEGLDQFRQRFRERAARLDRPVKDSDLAGVLAYDSLTTLARITLEQGTTVPRDLMSLLQLNAAKWRGLATDRIHYDSGGVSADRKPVLVTLKDGAYVTLK